MRHHGWELPYHPLQVVAIAVFISLAFAFYVFFIPFLGSKILEYHVIALFSPLVIIVFALYIRCAATNPADPGVDKCNDDHKAFSSSKKDSSLAGSPDKHHTDTEDLLYCSLCEAKIYRYSKHCRACDKCVDGFDHHCRWINNCIGKKNYKTFIALMISGLLLLVLQWTVGIFVITRCLLHRKEFDDDIISKLGSSFSLVPFIVVVALCTILAMLATFPLGQLFFFHVILIHKGMSTYDYIVAMRERDHLLIGGGDSSQSSPLSSVTTAVSGVSSLGVLQRRPWCTPPRLLVERQDTLVRDHSDIEQGGSVAKKDKDEAKISSKHQQKKAVKINPWKLARLNAEDASKAAERARNNSSVRRQVNPTTTTTDSAAAVVVETDSSLESPAQEIVPASARKTKRKRDISPAIISAPKLKIHSNDNQQQQQSQQPQQQQQQQQQHHSHHQRKISRSLLQNIGHDETPLSEASTAIPPLQLEARSAFWPDGLPSRELRPWLQRSTSDGYEASGGESADDSSATEHGRRLWNRASAAFISRSMLRSNGGGGSRGRFENGIRSAVVEGSSSSSAAALAIEANIYMKRMSGASTEESTSQNNSPDRDSDFFSAGEVTMNPTSVDAAAVAAAQSN